MKHLSKVLLTAGLALSCVPAWAGHQDRGFDTAKVISAVPIYQTVSIPVDEPVCWQEQAWRPRPHSAAPTVIGAVIGGVVGNQFGGGDGKTALTIAGAAIGGTIGYQVSRHHDHRGPYPVVEERCEMQRYWRAEERLIAWDVAYKYRGQVYHAQMPERPGKKIRVRVDARPVGY
jgi:uncharacterized protein YcfJ